MKKISFVAIILMIALVLPGCTSLKPTKQDLEVVGTLGGYEVTYDEFRYFVMNYKKQSLDSKYGNIEGNAEKIAEYEAELLQNVSSAMSRNYAIMWLCDNFKVDYNHQTINDKVDAFVDSTIEEFGSKKEYKKNLDKLYMTDRYYRMYIRLEQYALTELKFVFADDLGVIPGTDDELIDFMESDEFICVRHVYVIKDATSPEADKEKINMVYDKLESGEAFEDMIGAYSEDYTDTGRGFYFTHGEMSEGYEDIAFSLDEGEYSEIYEDDNGYYIIMRCEKDEEYMESNLTSFKYQIQYALTNNKIKEKQNEFKLELNDYGRSLDLYGMK